MKFYITNFGVENNIAESFTFILSFIPKYSNHQFVDNISEADVILFVNTVDWGYTFQPQDINNKPIIVIDCVEAGSSKLDSYFVGFYPFRKPQNDGSAYDNIIKEHLKLHEWLKSNITNVKMYFKREYDLNSPTLPISIYPIDFPAYDINWKNEIVSIEDFWNRPCSIAHIWGMTWPSRAVLHGELMKQYCGYTNLCCYEQLFDDFCYYQSKHGEVIVTLIYAQILNASDIDKTEPNSVRIPFDRMMYIFEKSKIVVSLWGHGRKCWRNIEAPFTSAMAIQTPGMYWSYPWIDGENCIFLPNRSLENGHEELDECKSVEIIQDYLNRKEDLYNIYLAGKRNWLNYRVDNYMTKYLIPKLENV